ncbi:MULTISPECIES: hypothetical protein [Bacillus cereus group]|uniref:hypothetical protein n=1 Tax=Bacillus cereus group TaxID=86661 RepID=UPI000EA19C6D|nr:MULTISPECIES: hypothetical protein [Bacillus cereus group]MBZ3765657.1 hypothetical protein [Bacillus cereus]MDF9530167.1 hypothetical protein [Bacillus cereus]MDG1578427.1 hypothetical protein [Bacillus cereus]RKI20206.1 hypothetical protein D7V71_28190 [Bacillus thuringiensis]HDR4483485.1 hypothetical protein [Bacillus cereus]
MFKKLVVGALAAGIVLGGSGSVFAYDDASTINCSKTVPTAWQMSFPTKASMPTTMVKCGKTFYLKEAYPNQDSFGTWTGVYKR